MMENDDGFQMSGIHHRKKYGGHSRKYWGYLRRYESRPGRNEGQGGKDGGQDGQRHDCWARSDEDNKVKMEAGQEEMKATVRARWKPQKVHSIRRGRDHQKSGARRLGVCRPTQGLHE
jgi:hypothetical protein